MLNLKLLGFLCGRAISDKFSGMALGRAWGILQPVLLILTYYVVFSFGLKVQGNDGSNYAAWLISGLLPWLFLNEGLMAVTTALKNNGPYLKRLSVPAAYVHIASLAPSVFNHIVLVLSYLIISVLVWDSSVTFSRLFLAFFYVLSLTFLLGVVLSVFYVYITDTIHVLQSLLSLSFWMTPIIWPSKIVPHDYQWIIIYNPMYFVVETYRAAMIPGAPVFYISLPGLFLPVAALAMICVPLYRNIKNINDFV